MTNRGASTQVATRAWNRAYEAFPGYAAPVAWPQVMVLLSNSPGSHVYEVGFGSGSNLRWAREHGWEVAGCEVAEPAYEQGLEELPGADLRFESIVDCSAPSDTYDVVVDRAAMSYVTPRDMKKAVAHVRRILKPGGIFAFNPHGVLHTIPFPPAMPRATKYDDQAVHRLLWSRSNTSAAPKNATV